MSCSGEPYGELNWSPVIEAIRTGQRFVLTTHVRADTDGIGSEIALGRHLLLIGKDVRILNPEPMPAFLALLDPDGTVGCYQEADRSFVEGATVFILDVSERDRLGPLVPFVSDDRGLSVCIDHHLSNGRAFATLSMIDPAAPSTGVLVHDLLVAAEADIDPVTAQAIYATIVADTGSFRFSNTSSRVMRLAADLVDRGADPSRVARAVLGTYSQEKVRLLARALSQAGVDCDGRLAWCVVSRRLLEETRADESDADGLIEYLRLLGTVRTAVMFVEQSDGQVKVSFRSENGWDVSQLAARWGGGGHRHAAGASLDSPLGQAVDAVLGEARLLFR